MNLIDKKQQHKIEEKMQLNSYFFYEMIEKNVFVSYT